MNLRAAVFLLVVALAAWPAINEASAVRVTTVLEEMDKSWQTIDDFSAVLLQQQTLTVDGTPRFFAGYARIVKPRAFRIDSREVGLRAYYDALDALEPSGVIGGASDEIVWYDGDRSHHWYRYRPAEAVVYREATPTSPIYVMLGALAGISATTAMELQENFNIDAPKTVRMLEQDCYLMRLEPRRGRSADFKYIDFWVDRKYYLPVRVKMKQDTAEVETYVLDPLLNRQLSARDIELRVPRGVVVREREALLGDGTAGREANQ
ncbi:hypothetical protein HS125_15665 [bacterium]|nr:hypothetical protein [bacterium]